MIWTEKQGALVHPPAGVKEYRCAMCGMRCWSDKAHARFCSVRCQNRYYTQQETAARRAGLKRRASRTVPRVHARVCSICGQHYMAANPRSRICTEACRARGKRARRREEALKRGRFEELIALTVEQERILRDVRNLAPIAYRLLTEEIHVHGGQNAFRVALLIAESALWRK